MSHLICPSHPTHPTPCDPFRLSDAISSHPKHPTHPTHSTLLKADALYRCASPHCSPPYPPPVCALRAHGAALMPPALMLPSALGTWSMFLGPVCAPVTVLSPMERARGSLMAVSAPQALYSWWVPPALLLHPCLGTRWEEGLGEPGCWGAGSGGSSP